MKICRIALPHCISAWEAWLTASLLEAWLAHSLHFNYNKYIQQEMEVSSLELNYLFNFIDQSTSPFHAVREASAALDRNGFSHLEEMQTWDLEPGGKYYVTRNQSSIIAFELPQERPQCYHITASHSDSPSFRIKKCRMDDKKYARAEVEGYGGMIMSSWLDRPLSYAGRVLVRTSDGVESRLVSAKEDVFVIPNLAIHFNREINKGYSYNPQIDMQPLYGGSGSDLMEYIAARAGADAGDILDLDLFLYTRQKAVTAGIKKELYMAPRIDDLASASAALEGFLEEKKPDRAVSVWCMFDNEEVGSGTRQGALGNFLTDTISRLEECFGIGKQESAVMKSRSLALSVDNAHAVHPNHAAKSDLEFPVYLNDGIVIKYNASQRYTTTGLTAAVFAEICEKNDVPLQRFANRADSPGGSTLGNLLGHQFSVPMADIGLPQLAMHSAVETAGCKDYIWMKTALREFYNSPVIQTADGRWTV